MASAARRDAPSRSTTYTNPGNEQSSPTTIVNEIVADAAFGPQPGWRCENGQTFERCRAGGIVSTILDLFGVGSEDICPDCAVDEVADIVAELEETASDIFDRVSRPILADEAVSAAVSAAVAESFGAMGLRL